MSEPEHEPLEELADSLFEAGREERATPEARSRALAALGLDLPGGGSGDAGSGGSPAAAPSGALKVLAVAGVAGAVAFGVWLASTSSDATPATPIAVASSAPVAPSQAVVPIEVPPAASEAPAPAVVESAVALSAPKPARLVPSATPSVASAHVDAAAPDDLAAELAALDRARTRLRSGDATGALGQLDAYTKDHPRGALSTEATLLRIEALVVAGQKEEARKVAGPLLERRPGDMTGDRARKLLER